MNTTYVKRMIVEVNSHFNKLPIIRNAQYTIKSKSLNDTLDLFTTFTNFSSIYSLDRYEKIKASTYQNVDKMWGIQLSYASNNEEKSNIDNLFSQIYRSLNELFREFDNSYGMNF